MGSRNHTVLSVICLIMMALVHSPAGAAERASVSVMPNTTAVQPGQQGVLAVVVNIAPGFHAQSHTPSQPGLIAFAVSSDAASDITFYEPLYPAGEDVTYPGLGKLNVYTGRVVVYVPFKVNPNAKPGALSMSGAARYQICDDKMCYAPKTTPWTVATSIVAAGQAVAPANEALFTGFNWSVFGKLHEASSGDKGTTMVASTSRQADGAELTFFGMRMHLGQHAYGWAFLAAFGVGIIFNLMPCVLPVVPLKAIGFYEVSQHHRGKSFGLGLVFSAGILAAFAVLASLLFVFKSLTWGEQFSRGWFVWTIVAILVVMALSMFGAFSVLLPRGAYAWAPRHDTVGGNFLFGIFATILSTPCTAPMFVGLLAWAALQPTSIAVGLVMVVGAGMAFPYLVLSATPELARRLPRTGAWAELIKHLMGFLLLAVAVYFAGGRLISGRSFMWGVFLVLAAGCGFMVVRTAIFARRKIAVAIVAVIALAVTGGALAFTIQSTQARIQWQPYSAEALASARASGKVVVVEFTANWCANCIALEASVLNDPATAAAIDRHDAVTLRADLTSESAVGWALLRELSPGGGIPLTAVYGPAVQRPVQLSSLYQTQDLVASLDQAKGL